MVHLVPHGLVWIGYVSKQLADFTNATCHSPLYDTIDPAEIFPLRARAKGMSLAVSSNWLCNFAVGQWTPELLDRIGWATYIFYMAFNVVAFFIGMYNNFMVSAFLLTHTTRCSVVPVC